MHVLVLIFIFYFGGIYSKWKKNVASCQVSSSCCLASLHWRFARNKAWSKNLRCWPTSCWWPTNGQMSVGWIFVVFLRKNMEHNMYLCIYIYIYIYIYMSPVPGFPVPPLPHPPWYGPPGPAAQTGRAGVLIIATSSNSTVVLLLL